jgi:hypothetical protein
MTKDILGAVLEQQSDCTKVIVAVARGNGWWKAYESVHTNMCGYPTHVTDNITEGLLREISRTGLAIDAKKAKKYFPFLPKNKNEN